MSLAPTATPPTPKLGRPPIEITPAMQDAVIEYVANGNPIHKISQSLGLSWMTFFRRLDTDKAFCDAYARARAMHAHKTFEQVIEMADNVVSGELGYNEGRVAIDAKKWVASRLAPALYGDRQQVEVSGSVNVNLTVTGFLDAISRVSALDQAGEVIEAEPVQALPDPQSQPSSDKAQAEITPQIEANRVAPAPKPPKTRSKRVKASKA